MQIGMIGLGRMGANMLRRLARDGVRNAFARYPVSTPNRPTPIVSIATPIRRPDPVTG